jgi:hypothetical protein
MSLIHQMWSPARLFSLYDALQLAARRVLAFLDSLEHRAIAVAPIIFSRTGQGLRAAARGDYPGGVGAKAQTTKITATMTSRQQNSGRPLAPGRMSIGRHLGLLKKLIVLRVSSGWLPE